MSQLPLDHVGIAVPSLDAALPMFEHLTGATSSSRERLDQQGVELVFVGTGPGRLELLQPTGPDSPVARFLDRRGAGLHHLAYRVADIDAVLRRLRADGFEPVDPEPRIGAHGHRVVFFQPRSFGGVLIELVEGAPDPTAGS
jgi:methylmalonyl-CoA/ethylmalonyl-CoA epimerase